MKSIRNILTVGVFVMLNACAQKTEKVEYTIYVAAGFRPAIEMIEKELYEDSFYTIQKNYASSGTLARQIANGAQCDIFISANKQWIDYLINKDLLDSSYVHVIASNSLVVIAPLNSDIEAPVFTSEFNLSSDAYDKIAIGNPEYVPVGKYTKMVLDSLGWFTQLSGSFIMCKDVSSVRHYVELGECDLGIVYYTEAIQSQKVKIITEIPNALHEPIRFYLACLKGGDKTLFKKLSNIIYSEKGLEILKKNGFQTNY